MNKPQLINRAESILRECYELGIIINKYAPHTFELMKVARLRSWIKKHENLIVIRKGNKVDD